jgi:hypothetical protein
MRRPSLTLDKLAPDSFPWVWRWCRRRIWQYQHHPAVDAVGASDLLLLDGRRPYNPPCAQHEALVLAPGGLGGLCQFAAQARQRLSPHGVGFSTPYQQVAAASARRSCSGQRAPGLSERPRSASLSRYDAGAVAQPGGVAGVMLYAMLEDVAASSYSPSRSEVH